MLARQHSIQLKDQVQDFKVETNKVVLRAPERIPLKRVEILLRPPQTTWVRDNSAKANLLLDGLASYLRAKDPK